MKDWLKIKNENDRVENLMFKCDFMFDNLDFLLIFGFYRKKRDLEFRVLRYKRFILGKLLKEFFSEKDICSIYGFVVIVC